MIYEVVKTYMVSNNVFDPDGNSEDIIGKVSEMVMTKFLRESWRIIAADEIEFECSPWPRSVSIIYKGKAYQVHIMSQFTDYTEVAISV